MMKIAVIGTGAIGSAYAQALTYAGYQVAIGHRDPAKAASLAQVIGSSAEGGGIVAAVKLADLVLLALPYPAVLRILALAGDLTGKVLVDMSNPVSADFQHLVVGPNDAAAERIQAAVPAAHVVKAFNTIFAPLVPKTARQDHALQVFIAGDNHSANLTVRTLALALGFLPVDAGPLRNSRYLEPIGMMNIQFGSFLSAGAVIAPAWVNA